jgi:hypothetical protein
MVSRMMLMSLTHDGGHGEYCFPKDLFASRDTPITSMAADPWRWEVMES